VSWFDKVQANLHDAAAKAGLTPEKLKSVADTLNQELSRIPDHAKALKAAAEQHGIEVGKIQEALAHAGAELGKAADQAAAQVGEAINKKPPPSA
jgi:DNA repair ATPase RecN